VKYQMWRLDRADAAVRSAPVTGITPPTPIHER
jgi:hypothetical protein